MDTLHNETGNANVLIGFPSRDNARNEFGCGSKFCIGCRSLRVQRVVYQQKVSVEADRRLVCYSTGKSGAPRSVGKVSLGFLVLFYLYIGEKLSVEIRVDNIPGFRS